MIIDASKNSHSNLALARALEILFDKLDMRGENEQKFLEIAQILFAAGANVHSVYYSVYH